MTWYVLKGDRTSDTGILQAQGFGGLAGLFTTGNDKPIHHSTEAMAKAANMLGLGHLDQEMPQAHAGLRQEQSDIWQQPFKPHVAGCPRSTDVDHDSSCAAAPEGRHSVVRGNGNAAVPQPHAEASHASHDALGPGKSSALAAVIGHSSIPASGAEHADEIILLQPSNVPAGVFLFGCKRPVQVSGAALAIGRKLAEKNQWGPGQMAHLAAAAPDSDLQQEEYRAGANSEPKDMMQHQNNQPADAACNARSVPSDAMHGSSAEPGYFERIHIRDSSQPDPASEGQPKQASEHSQHLLTGSGWQADQACEGQPSLALQHTQAGGGSQHDQACDSQPDMAPAIQPDEARDDQPDLAYQQLPDQVLSSPEQAVCSGQGAYIGSAGVIMSSWGESQLMALPSLAQYNEEDEQHDAEADLHQQQMQAHPVNFVSVPGNTSDGILHADFFQALCPPQGLEAVHSVFNSTA